LFFRVLSNQGQHARCGGLFQCELVDHVHLAEVAAQLLQFFILLGEGALLGGEADTENHIEQFLGGGMGALGGSDAA